MTDYRGLQFASIKNRCIGVFPAKMISVVAYLRLNCNLNGKVTFTLNHLVKNIGYKPNPNKGRINDQVRDFILKLNNEKTNYAISRIDGDISKNNECVTLWIDLENADIFSPTANYTMLYADEYDKIIGIKYLHPEYILMIYLVIKSVCSHPDSFMTFYYCDSVENIKNRIAGSTGDISVSTIKMLLSKMVETGLLQVDYGKKIKKDNKVIFTPNYYCPMHMEMDHALCAKIRENHFLIGID